jgi:hypothetical protein
VFGEGTAQLDLKPAVLFEKIGFLTARLLCCSARDAERGLASRCFIDAFDRLHSGEGRANAAPVGQRFDGRLVALCDNFDRSVGPVPNGASKAEALRLAPT